MESELKQINILGSNNRYQIKKLINNELERKVKKRVHTEKWCFSNENYEYSKQIQMILDISNNNLNYINDISKIAIQEINKKIYGYKQQDKIKKHFNFLGIFSRPPKNGPIAPPKGASQ